MSTTRTRILVALCGILGTAALGVYFGAAPPLPPADASVTQVASAAAQFHDKWLLGAWIQAIGALLSVVFFVALVHLAGGAGRLAGSLTFIGSAILLSVTLIEGAFTIDIAEAAANGHAATALGSYDLMGVFIHIYPLAPAPLILVPLGVVLLGSRLLPRILGYLALGLGIAYLVVGFAGLFLTPLLTLVVLSLQSVWVVTAAIVLVFRRPAVQTSPVSALARTA
jgi:hypothetical protein